MAAPAAILILKNYDKINKNYYFWLNSTKIDFDNWICTIRQYTKFGGDNIQDGGSGGHFVYKNYNKIHKNYISQSKSINLGR